MGQFTVEALDCRAQAHKRMMIEVAHNPRSAHIVVTFGAPLIQFVAKNESIELGYEDILIAVEAMIKGGDSINEL